MVIPQVQEFWAYALRVNAELRSGFDGSISGRYLFPIGEEKGMARDAAGAVDGPAYQGVESRLLDPRAYSVRITRPVRFCCSPMTAEI
jgi:hypothetical protein